VLVNFNHIGMSKENLIIIGSLCALALAVVFLIMPAFDSLSANGQIIAEKKSTLEQTSSFNQKIEEMNRQYKAEELERLLSVLPKEEELPSLLIQLEALATSNGLIMESVDFSEITQTSEVTPPQPSPELQNVFPKSQEASGESVSLNPQEIQSAPYKILAVRLKLNGGYGAFKNYLQAVEKNLRLMDVTSLDLNSSSGTAQNFAFSVNLQVYYQ